MNNELNRKLIVEFENDFKQIKLLSQQALLWSEEYAKNYPNLFNENLDYVCAISSSYLSYLLELKNIPHKVLFKINS
jgi:hypothetical protein